ncbi:MAG: type IX secretion system membrane protein PorP/SprF [Bacteroidota bacterium]
MNYNVHITKKVSLLLLLCLALCTCVTYGQEETSSNTDLGLKSPVHNQLFFNRYLINPTFSLVRENKSYLNILHRNQYASFEDNFQNYYVGFSNRFNERTALGISVYSQREGVIQEFGFNANYATSVRLGSKSRLTFGTNVTYLSEGINKDGVVATENDPSIQEARTENKVSVQPGITLSLGNFDVGLYATDLLQFNQTTNDLITNFNDRSVKASLQYTHTFMATRGLFENARFMPLLQVGKNENDRFSYIGSLLLDLPNYGWLQTTLDETYGMSLGLGFNLNKKLSLGYVMEKDLTDQGTNLGWNHELSLGYTFKDENPDAESAFDYATDKRVDEVVRNYEEQIVQLMADRENNGMDQNSLAMENRLILDELMLRQDSIETTRNEMFNKKFETLIRLVRNEMNQDDKGKPQSKPKTYHTDMGSSAVAYRKPETKAASDKKEYRKDYLDLPIKVLNRSDIVGVKSGYYMIANVYKNKRWLNAFMDRLKKKGLNAKHFYNKENGLYYVYLADFKMKGEAETAFVSNLNGKYRDEKWIMQVDNITATADVVFEN